MNSFVLISHQCILLLFLCIIYLYINKEYKLLSWICIILPKCILSNHTSSKPYPIEYHNGIWYLHEPKHPWTQHHIHAKFPKRIHKRQTFQEAPHSYTHLKQILIFLTLISLFPNHHKYPAHTNPSQSSLRFDSNQQLDLKKVVSNIKQTILWSYKVWTCMDPQIIQNCWRNSRVLPLEWSANFANEVQREKSRLTKESKDLTLHISTL